MTHRIAECSQHSTFVQSRLRGGSGGAAEREFERFVIPTRPSVPGNDSMEVQVDFSINHAADSFDQARRFVLRFALGDHFLDRCAGRDGECPLIDGLVARVQLRDNEMAGSTKGQHACIESIVIGAETREAR